MSQLMISSIEKLNKKHYLLSLSDGQFMQLSITDMFSIKVMQEGRDIAYIHFQPLSSLNNIEMSPIYRITDYQAPSGIFSVLTEGLLQAILSVYAFYTHGIIRPWRAVAERKSLTV